MMFSVAREGGSGVDNRSISNLFWLALTPKRSLIVHSLGLGSLMALFGLVVALIIAVCDVALSIRATNVPPPRFTGSDIFGSVVFAPVVETVILSLWYLLICRWLKWKFAVFLGTTLILAGLAHADRGFGGFMAAGAFTIFGCQFTVLNKRYGYLGAVSGVAISHAQNNGLIYLSSFLLKLTVVGHG